MSDDPFLLVGPDEQSKVYDTLTAAFANDPVERWLYPDLAGYHEHFPTFLAAFGGRAFQAETVWRLGDFAAVALWLPPGTEPDGERIVSVLTDSVATSQHNDLFAVLEAMDTAHPRYPHWYLPWFGVDAAMQGSGLGSQLMRACLEVIDDSHLPVYLETPNPRTVAFYERHGFTVTGDARSGTCPPMTFMQRPAS
jgi:ribosomal protein S18 acetylase RimI-like enzyme